MLKKTDGEACLLYTSDTECLTEVREPDEGPCQVGSLTGAVASEKVSKEPNKS